MSSAPGNGSGSGSSSDLDDEFLRVLDAQQGEEKEDSEEDQPSPSSSDERREATIVQNLASAAAGGGTSTDDNDTALATDSSHVHDIDQSGLAHQSNTNDDHANSDSRDGGIDDSSLPLQQQAIPSHASTSTTTHNTTTDENTLSQALMNQVREYNRLHQAHIQQQTSETETGADCMANDDEDRSNHHTHTDHDIQTSLRDLILQSSEHKSDTNTIGTAHDSDSEVEGNRERNRSVDIDQEIVNAQEREYERLQQRRLKHEQEMESQANRQHAFDRLFPMCNIEDEMGRRRRGRFVQNFHLATSTQTDVNTYRMTCASCSANLYTAPTAVLSFCPICKNITTSTIQEGKTPE